MLDPVQIQLLRDVLTRHVSAWVRQHGEASVRDWQAQWWSPTDADVGRAFLAELDTGDPEALVGEIGRAARVLVILAVLAVDERGR